MGLPAATVMPEPEELEYLQLRQQLKETIRMRMRNETNSGLSSSQWKENCLPHDNYGSFFGPSQPAIARRLIEERKSVLKVQQLATKENKRSTGLTDLKSKAQKLRESRDYSFLHTAVCELPKLPVKVSSLGAHLSESAKKTMQPIDMPVRKESSTLRDKIHHATICQLKPGGKLNTVAQPAKRDGLHTKTPTSMRTKAYDKNYVSGVHKALLKNPVANQPSDKKKGKHIVNNAKQMQNQQQSSSGHQATDEHKPSSPELQVGAKRKLEEGNDPPEPKKAKSLIIRLKLPPRQQAPNQSEAPSQQLKFSTGQDIGEGKSIPEPSQGKQTKGLPQSVLQQQIKQPTVMLPKKSLAIRLKLSSQQKDPNQSKTPVPKLQPSPGQLLGERKRVPEASMGKQTKVLHKNPSEQQINRWLLHTELNSILKKLARHDRHQPLRTIDVYENDTDCMVSNFEEIQREERKSARTAKEEDKIERLRLEKEEKNRLRRKSLKEHLQPKLTAESRLYGI